MKMINHWSFSIAGTFILAKLRHERSSTKFMVDAMILTLLLKAPLKKGTFFSNRRVSSESL